MKPGDLLPFGDLATWALEVERISLQWGGLVRWSPDVIGDDRDRAAFLRIPEIQAFASSLPALLAWHPLTSSIHQVDPADVLAIRRLAWLPALSSRFRVECVGPYSTIVDFLSRELDHVGTRLRQQRGGPSPGNMGRDVSDLVIAFDALACVLADWYPPPASVYLRALGLDGGKLAA